MITEHFSVSIYGRKHVCRLAYSLNKLENWELRRCHNYKPFSSH